MHKITRQVEAFWYTPKSDAGKPHEEQTRIKLRPLTQGERMGVLDEMDVIELKDDGTRIKHSRSWRQALALAQAHILEVENFPPGAPAPWPADGSDAEKAAYLAQMDEFEVFLIGNEVRERSRVSDALGN